MSLQTREFKTYNRGDMPSASDFNLRADLLSKVLRSLNIDGIMDSTGLLTRTRPDKGSGFIIKLYEVQSVASGDGIYACYEQTLDATEWGDTAGDSKIDDKNTDSVDVLNLAEFDPEPAYIAHLAAGDLIVAWKKIDDEANTRWIGLPLRQANADRPRRAFVKTAPGAASTVTCFLDIDTTGTEITVSCDIAQGGSALNAAVPRLADGDGIMVSKVGATWRCLTIFQTTEDCDCYSA